MTRVLPVPWHWPPAEVEQETNVKALGNMSLMRTPVAAAEPRLETVIVYVSVSPALAELSEAASVILRSVLEAASAQDENSEVLPAGSVAVTVIGGGMEPGITMEKFALPVESVLTERVTRNV